MPDIASPTPSQDLVDQAVASGGAYEVLSKRLADQGRSLHALATELNQARIAEFGSGGMSLLGRFRLRSENNCVGRDIVQVGGTLLFGYNVFIGLKQETRIEDVFSLYRLEQTEAGYDVVPVDVAQSFLGITSFVQDFRELYTYYKDTRLLELQVRDGKLLASFQIGARLTDIRVFRWSISPDGREVRYIDNRGERDIALPAPFDFEWTRAGREHVVNGRHPHLNILDTVFVETLNGDLTIKVENNTEDGMGIYREEVMDKTQSLDDAAVEFARVGSLILLKILPYREEQTRYLVFNTLTRKVQRIDAIGLACIQLPEDHGILFPGGYYLQSGENRAFDQQMDGMRFRRSIRSPNGEDVLYVFYEPTSGRIALFTYNLISRELQPPLIGHGYARLEDGRVVLFSSESDEPTRIHPMQVWHTPFFSDEYAARQPAGNSFFSRIGNADLVRGLSELFSLSREIDAQDVSVARYQRLIDQTRRLFDRYHWMSDAQGGALSRTLHEIAASGEAVLDEYEKVESIRAASARAMSEAETRYKALLAQLRVQDWKHAPDYVQALQRTAAERGHLLTLRDMRYIDRARIDAMEAELVAAQERIGAETARFLASDEALQPYAARLDEVNRETEQAASVAQLAPLLQGMEAMSAELDTLSELMATLHIEDATQRTAIVESISAIYARLNQTKARSEQRRRSLGSNERVAQFGAQFTLFSQSITSALSLAQDPERCDEQLSRLLVQLEELESQFGEYDAFLGDIVAKREELLETFESHKQTLLDERQRKAQAVQDAALRILDGLGRRTKRLGTLDELNAFFAGDPLILKLRELTARLRELHDNVKADDVEARLKGTQDQALRALRDRNDLFEGGGNVIRLGRHRFSVNTQTLDLTLMPRGDTLNLHLVGTDYMEPLDDPQLTVLRPFWDVSLASESPQLYRGEYLALQLIAAARQGQEGWSADRLQALLLQPDALDRALREFAAPRYREGYERGIHDHDAARILQALLPMQQAAGVLAVAPAARSLAVLYWSQRQHVVKPEASAAIAQWPARARQSLDMQRLFASDAARKALSEDIARTLQTFAERHALALAPSDSDIAADYLLQKLADPAPRFSFTEQARRLIEALQARLEASGSWLPLLNHWRNKDGSDLPLAQRWHGALHWVQALCHEAASRLRNDPAQSPELAELADLGDYAVEAATWLIAADDIDHRFSSVQLRATVTGLLGEHPRIRDGAMVLAVDDLTRRAHWHNTHFVPGFQQYQQLRHHILVREREAMRLDEFKPRPLSSFVRNKLINDVYLSVIGDNLAKQMGTVGENRRSDQNGLLMMISPPGYGKTTLMEYVAHRLGLIFMKINGPSLGHEVRSIDPAQAPDATARQELEKLNLALEMGNNVMLYVDDIQHTHPEFLQKFISLSDGTRRIEGVWKGRTRTYDMRGKKFCVVMAGNPYTESGEVFKIPDMLANRADIYNLGDVLGGMEEVFKLSYIENSLTANPTLAPLATRDLKDLYLILDKLAGKDFSVNALSHDYSTAELRDIEATLQRMLQVREVVYRVNQQYIASAAQADNYRTEPPFRLQGSYRNMNKLAEKISAVMNDAELQQLFADHYQGEAQLLTTGAEENLLKLAELRGSLTAEQAERWANIKRDYLRNKAIGGSDTDTAGKIVLQLMELVEATREQAASVAHAARADDDTPPPWPELIAQLNRLAEAQTVQARHVAVFAQSQQASAPQANQREERLLKALARLMQHTAAPVYTHFEESRKQALGLHRVLLEIAERLRAVAEAESSSIARGSDRNVQMLERAFSRMSGGADDSDQTRRRDPAGS
ncbi:MAG: DNA repair ATPase [Rhodocyclaceae bacterium]